METLRRVLDGIDSLNEWCGKTFSLLSVVLTGVVVYDVVLRYFFSRPTLWGLELSCILQSSRIGSALVCVPQNA